jgi:hypothetical protein
MPRAAQRAMSCAYSFRDRESSETKMLVHMTNPLFALVDFAGFVEYITFAKEDLANSISAMSDSIMSRIGITLRETETAQGAFGTGEAEMKGVFLFLDANGAPLFRMAIPGIKDATLTGNLRDINLSHAGVAAFITAMTSGTVEHPVTANGYNLLSIEGGGAYKQHRHSTGGRKRRTG